MQQVLFRGSGNTFRGEKVKKKGKRLCAGQPDVNIYIDKYINLSFLKCVNFAR